MIENDGPNTGNINRALSKAHELCKKLGLKRITLMYSTKKGFQDSVIADFIGKPEVKALASGQSIELADNIRLEFDMPRNTFSNSKYDVVFAVYLGNEDIDRIDSIKNVKSIVFLPWLEDIGKRWFATWHPEIVGPSTWCVTESQLSVLVSDAISQIGRCINKSTGLGKSAHASDKALAKRIFSELKKQGIEASEEEIREFAVHNGWNATQAQELASFAKKYV